MEIPSPAPIRWTRPWTRRRDFANPTNPGRWGEKASLPLDPVFDQIQSACDGIDSYDKQIEELSGTSSPQTSWLRQVHGVGLLIALAFVVTVSDPKRFAKSRTLGAYFGWIPRLNQSGMSSPMLGITKAGDRFMGSLLVSAATRILGPKGVDSDLRRCGERVLSTGGARARGRARIVVARKLSVRLHRLLRTGEVYEPLRNSPAEAPAA